MLPYLKSKLHTIYNKEREATLQASLWGHGDDRFNDNDYSDGGDNSFVSTSGSDMEVSARTRLTKRIKKIVGVCYPWIHAGNEGACIFILYIIYVYICFLLFLPRIAFYFRIHIVRMKHLLQGSKRR